MLPRANLEARPLWCGCLRHSRQLRSGASEQLIGLQEDSTKRPYLVQVVPCMRAVGETYDETRTACGVGH